MKNNKPFVFLVQKGWRGTNWDRGGVQYCLLAFAEEFSKDENVRLIVKLNPAYIDLPTLNTAMAQLNLPKDRPEIQISLENIPFDTLHKIYNDGDVFICATRAESFNLPGLEAMACGLPTVQTDFGGQTDYMTDKNSLFINYKLETVTDDMMYEEVKWATPDIEDIKKQMRWCFDNQDKVKQMRLVALEDSKKWSWENSAKKLIKLV